MAGLGNWWALLLARLVDPLRGDSFRWWVGATLFVAVVVGAVFAYLKWGRDLIAPEVHQVAATDILVAPEQPGWIYGNVKAEVLRSERLQKLNALDPGLIPRIIDAFEKHPWVKAVRFAEKRHPNQVRVELDYRRPAAMVQVVEAGQRGISPVDGEGVVLPTDGFTHRLDRPGDYLRINAGEGLSPGVVGTRWQDARVTGAAAIAEQLRAQWRAWGLYQVVVLRSEGDPRNPLFGLATRQRVAVIWGHAPGQETQGEAKAAQKKKRLTQFVKQQGSLDIVSEDHVLDLRGTASASLTPRTARRP